MKKHILSLILLGLLSVDISVAMQQPRKRKRKVSASDKLVEKKKKTLPSSFVELFYLYHENDSNKTDDNFLKLFKAYCSEGNFNDVVYDIAGKDTFFSLDWFLNIAFISKFTKTIEYMLAQDNFKKNKNGVLKGFLPHIHSLDVLKVFLAANKESFQYPQENDKIVQELRNQLNDIGNKNYIEFTTVDENQKKEMIEYLNTKLPKKPFWKKWFDF